jgi:hypothetical protein
MHEYEARISWARDGAAFTDQRYSAGASRRQRPPQMDW